IGVPLSSGCEFIAGPDKFCYSLELTQADRLSFLIDYPTSAGSREAPPHPHVSTAMVQSPLGGISPMASAEIPRPAEMEGPRANPLPWTMAGVGAGALAFLWVVVFKESLTPVRVLLVFGGVVAAGAAIAIKPKPQIILGGAAAAFLGALALYSGEGRSDHWDSIRLVLAVAAVVAALAALITALPKIPRRIFVSVVIVMHF